MLCFILHNFNNTLLDVKSILQALYKFSKFIFYRSQCNGNYRVFLGKYLQVINKKLIEKLLINNLIWNYVS